MNSLWRLRHRVSTRLAVFVAVLLFSATAVEVAPQAIDVLQDLGWLAPDVADAPAEAAALSSPDESRHSGSATGTPAVVEGVAFDRLVQFADSQPDPLDYPLNFTAAVDTADQTNATALLEGIVSLNTAPDVGTAFPGMRRSSTAGSPSSATFGGLSPQAVIDAGTLPDELPVTTTAEVETDAPPASVSASSGSASAGREVTGGLSDQSTPTANATSAVDRTSANDFGGSSVGTGPAAGSSPSLALTEALPESGPGANASLDISPVAIPEPGTLLLLGAGLFGLTRFGKRKVAR